VNRENGNVYRMNGQVLVGFDVSKVLCVMYHEDEEWVE
jgi:hypothetical protein